MIAIDRPMPKSCADCPCNDHDAWCAVTLSDFADDFCNTRLPDCPLIDLTDDGKRVVRKSRTVEETVEEAVEGSHNFDSTS